MLNHYSANDPRVEVVSTRDLREDLADGSGWRCVSVRPPGDGWLQWDTRSDRHTGWLRVRGGYIHDPPDCWQ